MWRASRCRVRFRNRRGRTQRIQVKVYQPANKCFSSGRSAPPCSQIRSAWENTLATADTIGKSFGLSNQGQVSWLIAGYSLTIGNFILIGGRLGDDFGNKRIFVIGMAWYALWSLVAGVAVYSSYVLFIFSRVFQGYGPSINSA